MPSCEDGKTTEALAEYDRLDDEVSRDIAHQGIRLGPKGRDLRRKPTTYETFARSAINILISDFPKPANPRMKAASEFWIGWSLFRRDKLEESMPALRARPAKPGPRRSRAGNRLSTSPSPTTACRSSAEAEGRTGSRLLKRLPEREGAHGPVFAWLGTKLRRGGELPGGLALPPKRAITPESPSQTKIVVWRAAGRSALESGAYPGSPPALSTSFSKSRTTTFARPRPHYFLARAHVRAEGLRAPPSKAAEACLERSNRREILNARNPASSWAISGWPSGKPADCRQALCGGGRILQPRIDRK